MFRFLPSLLIVLVLSIPAAAGQGRAVTVDTLAKTGMSWNGTILPAYPEGRPEVTLLRISIAPGTQLPMHLHPVINVGLMLKGELTVITEKGDTLHLRPGDPIVEVVDQWHYGRNDGAEDAEIIVFYAGTEGKPISVNR